jgi:acyl-CoA-binding protein
MKMLKRLFLKESDCNQKTDESHLIDQVSFACFSTQRKNSICSTANKKLIDSGLDPYDAFNIVQHQMIDVAQAYLERVVLEQFQETIQDIKDKNSKEVMLKLYQLYALSQIEKKIKDISRMVIWKLLKQKPYARWLISCAGKLDQMLFL